MTSRLLVLPAMLLAFGCTGGVKESDTTTTTVAAADTSNAIALADTTAGASSASGSAGRPGVGGLGRTGASTRKPSATPSGRAADARGVPVSDSTRVAAPRETATSRGTSRDTVASRDSAVSRSSSADSARGIVAVVGTSLDSRVVLRPARGGRSVTLIGPMSRDVGRLSGADVWATGNRDEHGQLRVSRFSVRSVDGNAALDGTLIARGAQMLLVTRDGVQHALENAPASLKQHVGARVWITGATGGGAIVYGVIEERR
jgi:hypothetical protein